jgi:translation initiation factor 1
MSKITRQKKKIATTSQESGLENSPFSILDAKGLPDVSLPKTTPPRAMAKPKKVLGQGERLEIRREKSGRGGKTVTTVLGFPTYLGEAKKSKMLKTLKTTLGTGGTWNGKLMELQGDRRDEIFQWCKESGFNPVLAGG